MENKIVADTEKRRPPRAGKGRPPGAQNKLTRSVRQAIEQAFERAGGVEWLVRLAEEDPKSFAALLARLVPSDVRVEQRPPVYNLVNAFPDDDYDPAS